MAETKAKVAVGSAKATTQGLLCVTWNRSAVGMAIKGNFGKGDEMDSSYGFQSAWKKLGVPSPISVAHKIWPCATQFELNFTGPANLIQFPKP